MSNSIINLLNQKGYYPIDVDDEIIIKIDSLLENPKLKVELCDRKLVWTERKSRFKYNMKLLLLTKPDGWIIDETRYIYLGKDVKLSFIYKKIYDFIERENIKYLDRNSNFQNDKYENSDDDEFSERNIMRDLENGEGYKHGLD
jgi:hypothetical protein